jgi:hypothetical protein
MIPAGSQKVFGSILIFSTKKRLYIVVKSFFSGELLKNKKVAKATFSIPFYCESNLYFSGKTC